MRSRVDHAALPVAIKRQFKQSKSYFKQHQYSLGHTSHCSTPHLELLERLKNSCAVSQSRSHGNAHSGWHRAPTSKTTSFLFFSLKRIRTTSAYSHSAIPELVTEAGTVSQDQIRDQSRPQARS